MTDFALRIFLTDYYLTKPLENVDHTFNDFSKKPISQVPIIRIFASTPKGQKVCAHIHGVYPYFYVPFFEDISIILNKDKMDKFLHNFSSSLSSAIDLSMNNRVHSESSHIFRITLVKGKPFYGYQENLQYFLKIYLYNPNHVKKAGNLLLFGAVMNKPIQPYETHIPYNLKFFIDYNLYGMNYLYTDAAMFRVNKEYCPEGSFIDLDISDSLDLSQKMWNVDQIPPDCIMDEKICWKTSFCELEVDICACDILNIQEVQKSIGENPGLKDLWEEEKQRRIKLGLNVNDLVGELFEERPMARSTTSQEALLEEWKNICGSVKDDIVSSDEVDGFISGSPFSVTDEDCDDELGYNESVNEDSIKETLKSGDSFVLEAIESNQDIASEADREMSEFINACIKMEEEDSIIPDRMSTATCITTIDLITKKCPSFSQHNSGVINIDDGQANSDEDIFNQTFIDLSLDDSDHEDDSDDEDACVIISDSEQCKENVSSEDLFDDESVDMSSDSESSNKEILKSHDGADDDDEDDEVVVTSNKKRRKLDSMANPETQIVTRSKHRLDSCGQPIQGPSYYPEKRNRKKPHVRKARPSLTLKNYDKLSNQSLSLLLNANEEPMVIDLANDEDIVNGHGPVNRPNQSTPLRKTPSFPSTSSTPLRPNFAPINMKFIAISPIMKPKNRHSESRQRTVSFSIPEVSQESPDKSRIKSQISQKLDTLESMKKTVFNSLQQMSARTDFLSQRFQATMMSHVTVLSAELLCSSQSTMEPNPATDSPLMFFYSLYHQPDIPGDKFSVYEEGVIFIDPQGTLLTSTGISDTTSYRTVSVPSEPELFNEIIALVMKFDPDILLGYETTRSSWGYILERSFHLKHRLFYDLGRLPTEVKNAFKNKECSFTELHVPGRIILDLWIVMKYELTLTSYTVENVVDDVLKERVPSFTNQQLMAWYRSNVERHRVIDYYKYRVLANLRLVHKLDVISRTAEFAKIYGIEFYHVLSRGSQYRVEAMMLRLAKPQNLIALSPSVQQRAHQKAPECIPLTLEPQSGFYKDPVVVLDFQSLYPSVMIAYNYCFSTSLGKLSQIRSVEFGEDFEFGCGKMNVEKATIRKIGHEVNFSPNEVAFVRPHTFKGIISKMVDEILNTRIMVKKSMKIHKDNKALCKLLDSRQLGLKLIANVTFGYTAACFSGRMPCVEVGDSIMRKSRETLEEAIALVNSGGPEGHPLSDQAGGWHGCQVIYGDTDSMFVLMPGRSKEQAFMLGARLADAVTAINPFPVKLKFEKVFLPCLLEAKKRYVGYSYETVDQVQPKFDAKGIETVRRDNCNIVSKMLERTLIRLFEGEKMDSIRKYVTVELDKVLSGQVNMIDFIIAKEYRGRQTYRAGASVPALHIANKLRKKDSRSEPLQGERVQYVIVQGAPGDTLLSCVRQPCELLFNTKILKGYGINIRSLSEQGCRLSYIYYITKQIIPPLQRALSLVGADVFKWYNQMPKRQIHNIGDSGDSNGRALNRTITSYFISQKCILCDGVIRHKVCDVPGRMASVLCDQCLHKGGGFIYYTGSRQLRDIEDLRVSLLAQCNLCSGCTGPPRGIGPPCVSTDCPTLFRRVRAFQTPTDGLERLLQSSLF